MVATLTAPSAARTTMLSRPVTGRRSIFVIVIAPLQALVLLLPLLPRLQSTLIRRSSRCYDALLLRLPLHQQVLQVLLLTLLAMRNHLLHNQECQSSFWFSAFSYLIFSLGIMAGREQLHGQAIQDSGMNRHDTFPVAALPGVQYFEHPSVLEMMEHRAALQDDDTQNLVIENPRLLAGHHTLRQDLENTENEMRYLGDIEAILGMQMTELVGKMRNLEAEVRAGAAVKKELLQVHLEADKLRAEKQELSVELQKLTEELEKVEKRSQDNKSFPELHAELDGLQKEYQSIRSVFEHSRDINTKQVEQMKTMEASLIAMTKQVDKLRAEVQNAEMRAQGWAAVVQATAGQSGMAAQAQVAPAGTDPYGSAYDNLPAAYQQATQAGQCGVAQAPAASAAIYPYASPYASFSAAAYQPATQAWPYAYAAPYAAANPMACHQASGYAGYAAAGYNQNAVPYHPGYPAGYDQNALYYYPATYAAPQYTVPVNGVPATDAAYMNGYAGFSAGQVQTSGGTTTVVTARALYPAADGAYHLNPTQM